LGQLYLWPWPQASIYAIVATAREQLPIGFKLTDIVELPFEYYRAISSNLALDLRPKYGILTPPGDRLAQIASDSTSVLRAANAAIAILNMPRHLARRGLYDIFSDQNY
jgi:hypothetical protein